MNRFESIFVFGPSGAGKTTMVNGLRVPEFDKQVYIPPRYITRPKRDGDDMVENRHVSHERFTALVAAGEIALNWDRRLDNGRVERYGFLAKPENDPRLPVYSGNNALLRSREPATVDILRRGVGVAAFADLAIRRERLYERSPDMSPDERNARLGDDSREYLDGPYTVCEIDTTLVTPAGTQEAFRGLVRDVLSGVLAPDF